MEKYISSNVHKIGGAHLQCVNKSLELHITKTRNPKCVVDRRTYEWTDEQTEWSTTRPACAKSDAGNNNYITKHMKQ